MDDDCHQQHRHHDQTGDYQDDAIRSLNHGDHRQDEESSTTNTRQTLAILSAVNRYVSNPIRDIIFEPHSHITNTGIIDPGQRCRDVHPVPYQVDALDSQAAGEQPRPQPQHGAQPYAQSEIVDMKIDGLIRDLISREEHIPRRKDNSLHIVNNAEKDLISREAYENGGPG